MNDLIIRKSAIEAIVNTVSKVDDKKTLKDKYDGAAFRQHEIIDIIESLPPAQQWIPVEERLPECYEIMLVTYNDPRTHRMMVWVGWHDVENVWYICGKEHIREYGNEVMAWMTMPEPYKGEEI